MTKIRLWSAIFLFGGSLANSAAAAENASLLQIVLYGWQINLVIGGLLLLAVFLIIHFGLTTGAANFLPVNLLSSLTDDLANKDWQGAERRVAAKESLFGEIALAGLQLRNHSAERISVAMTAVGRRRLGAIKQKINYLANIGVIAPLLGLFGTILGLTDAFNALSAEGTLGMRNALLTAGVGKAMGTTLIGLLVGMLAMSAYYLCLSRFNRLADEITAAAENFAAVIGEIKG